MIDCIYGEGHMCRIQNPKKGVQCLVNRLTKESSHHNRPTMDLTIKRRAVELI